MKINITMDPKNKKRLADRTFYDSDYETRTMTMNWPRFLLVESGDKSLPVTKLSPFAIDKGFQALISGRLRSIKRLRNGTFLVECDTKKQSDLLLKRKKTAPVRSASVSSRGKKSPVRAPPAPKEPKRLKKMEQDPFKSF